MLGSLPMRCSLKPAYGRDYKSAKAVKVDFVGGMDFVLCTFDRPDTYINLIQLREGGCKTVNIRYGNLRKVCVLEVR